MTSRFHKAAIDNNLEVLKEATKRDCNARDEQGMTPTLCAAFHGNLDALRLLCGRGGDPDKADIFGTTALHLAAAQGHKNVVIFLINFGVNIFATDLDGKTARELAGMSGRDDILRYIDGVQGKLTAMDKKKVKALQERAEEERKKRIKEYKKRILKQEQISEKLEKIKSKDHKPSMIENLRSRIIGGPMTSLSSTFPEKRNVYSNIISGGSVTSKGNMSTVQRKILEKKFNKSAQNEEDDFKVSGIENGERKVSTLRGIRRTSEVLLGGTLEKDHNARRGRLDGIFHEAEYIDSTPSSLNSGLTRSKSQPDFFQQLKNEDNRLQQEPSSIFVRPGMGSIVIRKSITNSLGGFYGNLEHESSTGSAESYGPTRQSTDDELSESSGDEEEDNPYGPLERFLTAFGLREYLPKFIQQKIDLETLIILTESDLKSLNLPIGPHRILVNAILERKAVLENPGELKDSIL